MGGPRVKFRGRPKKSGAKKRQKVKSQRKRLVESGMKEEDVIKLTDREVREKHKRIGRKKK